MCRADLRDPKKRSDGDLATLKTPPNASTKTNLEKGGLHPAADRPWQAPLAARALLGYVYIYIYVYVCVSGFGHLPAPRYGKGPSPKLSPEVRPRLPCGCGVQSTKLNVSLIDEVPRPPCGCGVEQTMS